MTTLLSQLAGEPQNPQPSQLLLLLLPTPISSHIFCIECSNRCQLSGQREGQRPSCPACHVILTNPDDVIVTNLNPTEDYKTSILSGLHPNIIMECAGRALSFWAYQSTQEMFADQRIVFQSLVNDHTVRTKNTWRRT
jgi:hypothetical protein